MEGHIKPTALLSLDYELPKLISSYPKGSDQRTRQIESKKTAFENFLGGCSASIEVCFFSIVKKKVKCD